VKPNKLKVCILARKRLYRNTRVVRQAKALSEAGHEVTVAAIELPAPELRLLTPQVKYIHIDLEPWPEKVLGALSRINSRILSVPRRTKWAVRRVFLGGMNFLRRVLYKICSMLGLQQIPNFIRKAGAFEENFISLPTLIKKISASVAGLIVFVIRRFTHLLKLVAEKVFAYLRKSLLPFMNNAKNRSFAVKAYLALDGEQYDYCQAHDTHALIAASRIAGKTGAKLIYDALEIPDDRSGTALDGAPRWLSWWENRCEQEIIRSAEKVVAIGPALAQWTANYYEIETPVVVRNCSLYREQESNDQIRQDLELAEGEKVVVVVGSIYQGQGLEQLTECVKNFVPGVHLVALGPEVQPGFVAQMKKLIEEKGANGRFHILPPQPPSSLISYLSGADIGVIARQNTCLNNLFSLPNKVFEMVMARLPIASSRLPNIQALLEDYGIGLIFDETDPEDIAATINAMFEPEVYRRFKAAVDVAAKELCWEKEAQRYIQAIVGRME
jgi:glycosyltransferase involved in cell wall biosynthesis